VLSADTVQRLRLRLPAGGDALRLRHRAEAALAGGLPAPAGLPPGALLCVRRLALRLPVGGAAVLASQGAAGLRAPLEAAWAQAVRPWGGSPGAGAAALWFADEAELLAFLARRAAAGDTGAWWWPALVGRARAPWPAVAAAWAGRPRAVPGAVVQLGTEAEGLCAAMGEGGCGRVLAALVPAWGLPMGPGGVAQAQPGPWLSAAQPPGPVAKPPPARAGQAAAGPEPPTGPRATGAARLVPPAGQPAPTAAVPSHRLLVMLARALHERPWAASSTGFVAAVWRAAAWPSQGAAPMAEAGPRSAPSAPAHERGAPRAAGRASQAWSGEFRPKVVPPAHSPGGQPAQPRIAPPVDPSPAGGQPETAPSGARGTPPVLHTAYAGLFFVLPLLQRRGLLGDFTQPVPAHDSLHPAWLLQALLARHARHGDGDAQALARLLRDWAGAPRPRRSGPWRDRMATLHPLLQADAARALQRPARGTLAWLVRRPGGVRLSATRLDVHFDLAAHPLAIRAAGLDRDPGWIPAAGRHVAFHFELP